MNIYRTANENLVRKNKIFRHHNICSTRRRINSVLDNDEMVNAYEDIKTALFETLSGMSWLTKKGSRLDLFCNDLAAQVIGFEMDMDPSDILNEYLSL